MRGSYTSFTMPPPTSEPQPGTADAARSFPWRCCTTWAACPAASIFTAGLARPTRVAAASRNAAPSSMRRTRSSRPRVRPRSSATSALIISFVGNRFARRRTTGPCPRSACATVYLRANFWIFCAMPPAMYTPPRAPRASARIAGKDSRTWSRTSVSAAWRPGSFCIARVRMSAALSASAVRGLPIAPAFDRDSRDRSPIESALPTLDPFASTSTQARPPPSHRLARILYGRL